MASHKSTPEGVRNAPQSKPVVISPQRGPSRAERRAGRTGGLAGRLAGRNRPFERPKTLEDLERSIVEALEDPHADDPRSRQ